MPILEFAPINLNPGITTANESALAVFRKCLSAINKAPGVSGMRFMKCTSDQSIIVLHGVWATVEDHSDFLESGKMTSLLMDLKDFITMREVLQLDMTEITDAQKEVLASPELVSASFKLRPANHEKFEAAVESVLKSKTGAEVVTAWKIKDEESFKKAEDFGRKGLGQEREEKNGTNGREDPNTWTMIVKKGDAAFVDEIKTKVKGFVEAEEVLTWDILL
ncbi:MAG: hypothetical protein Q9161_008161 [Pseudevernia consocians]